MRAGAAKVWVATLARAQKEFVKRQHHDPPGAGCGLGSGYEDELRQAKSDPEEL